MGIGAVKYADLSKDRIGDYTFDWDTMLALDGNTAPYLQYAYARIQSIFRRAAGRNIPVTRPISANVTLDSPQERSLALHVLRFGEVIDLVARELKPHHLCTYLYELCGAFARFFESCPVLKAPSEPLKMSRLLLCHHVATVLKIGLQDLLGIDVLEEM